MQTQRADSWAQWRKEREGWIERVAWETYTPPHVKQIASGTLLYDSGNLDQCLVATWRGGMGWEVGQRATRKGTYIHLWLIHVAVEQKPTQYCKAIIHQLKINRLLKLRLKVFSKVRFYLFIMLGTLPRRFLSQTMPQFHHGDFYGCWAEVKIIFIKRCL